MSRETAALCCGRGGERWLALAPAHGEDGGRAVGWPQASASARAEGRDVGPVVCPDCVPVSKEGEGEESSGLCLKIRQSLGLSVTHSMLFSARLSH